MARRKRDANLESRTGREKLPIRGKPFYVPIGQGLHLGYRKGKSEGRWVVRIYDKETRDYTVQTIATADDTHDSDGTQYLSFWEAQDSARKQFSVSRSSSRSGPYTVADACDDYLADYLQRSGKDAGNMRTRLARIKKSLGSKEINRLAKDEVAAWRSEVASGGGLTRSKAIDCSTGQRIERKIDPSDPDALRRRKASANRLLSVLKAALNHAYDNPPKGVVIPSRAAWDNVKPFPKVDAPTIRYLEENEWTRLLNACAPDFRQMVASALLTGARYGELCRLRVRDFNAKAMNLRIEISKSGKPRSIALTEEGVQHFSELAKGKGSTALLLTRTDGEAWSDSHQLRRMADACVAAKIDPPISFHVLRHCYASRLAMSGAPMRVIADQLGHTDTRITERHYAHLSLSYVADTVRALFGNIGIGQPASNVQVLKPKRTAKRAA